MVLYSAQSFHTLNKATLTMEEFPSEGKKKKKKPKHHTQNPQPKLKKTQKPTNEHQKTNTP